MHATIERPPQAPIVPTSAPSLGSAPAWTIRVARPADADRYELAKELRGVPRAALHQVFGKLLGTHVWQQHRATRSAVEGAASTVANPSSAPVPDSQLSAGMLRYLCTEAASTLRERRRFAKSLSLTVLYANGESETAHELFLRATNDPVTLEGAAHAAIRGMRSSAFVSVKLDLTAAPTKA